MSKEKTTCNQCFKQLWLTYFGQTLVFVCKNPRCPNYSLVQVPAEEMPKESK